MHLRERPYSKLLPVYTHQQKDFPWFLELSLSYTNFSGSALPSPSDHARVWNRGNYLLWNFVDLRNILSFASWFLMVMDTVTAQFCLCVYGSSFLLIEFESSIDYHLHSSVSNFLSDPITPFLLEVIKFLFISHINEILCL